MRALQRGISDHTPLLVDSGEAVHWGNKDILSFETSWFEREGFTALFAREWEKDQRGDSTVDRWQFKIQHLRQFLKGWAKNYNVAYKRHKDILLNIINDLDIKSERGNLSTDESVTKGEAEVCLAKLLREEEIKCALRAKVT